MVTRKVTVAPTVTLEEYAALPEYPRYELVAGVLVKQMVTSAKHEETVSLVIYRLMTYTHPRHIGRVYASNRGYVTGPDSPATCRMPDVSFVATDRLGPDLLGMLFNGSPDLAVEILSDSNTRAEIAQKTREYLGAGGKAVWIVDVDARTIIVHTSTAAPQVLNDGDNIQGGAALPDFTCAVAELLPVEE